MSRAAHVDDSDLGAILQLTASLEALAAVRAHIRSGVAALGGDQRTSAALVQSVDEWVTNVVVHGYGGPGPVEVRVRRDQADIVVDVRDQAPVYDPDTAPPFDRDVPLAQRPFGGMGISLIRDLCSGFEHRGLPQGGNEVTMRRPARSAPPADDDKINARADTLADTLADDTSGNPRGHDGGTQ